MQRISFRTFPHWLDYVLLILATLSLLSLAFNNGYPLIYPDTGTYILSGHTGIVPVDRPLMYALFVRHTSMSFSLWFVIVAQALLTVGVIMLTSRCFWSNTWLRKSWMLTLLLSLGTGISYYTSQIMPDIFTPLVILGAFLFCYYLRKSWIISLLLGIFVIFCNMTHYSNLIISTLLVFPIILAAWISANKLIKIQHALWLALLIGLTWVSCLTFNYIYDAGFRMSRTSNVFFMARLQEIGLLSDYLEDECGNKNIPLCAYKDEFPQSSVKFLWTNSPLYDNAIHVNNSWDSVWLIKDKEYAPVIRDMMTTPKYLKKFIGVSISETALLLTKTSMDDLSNSISGTPVPWMIPWQYKDDLKMFNASKQAQLPFLHFGITGLIQTIAVAISLAGILLILCFKKLRRRIPSDYYQMLLVIFSGSIINAWTCTTFSTLITRYQSRIVWLIPLAFLVLLFIVIKKPAPAETGQDDSQTV